MGRAKIDYIDLQSALYSSKYFVGWYWGSPPMCTVHATEQDAKDLENKLATIETRIGAFKT